MSHMVDVKSFQEKESPVRDATAERDSCGLALTLSARLLMPKSPSPSPGGGDVLVTEPCAVNFPVGLATDGVCSFQATTTFRTEVSGDLGEA